MFKDKKYWMLMPPFLVLAIALFIYTDKFHYGFLAVIVFWIVYHTWTYIDKKK